MSVRCISSPACLVSLAAIWPAFGVAAWLCPLSTRNWPLGPVLSVLHFLAWSLFANNPRSVLKSLTLFPFLCVTSPSNPHIDSLLVDCIDLTCRPSPFSGPCPCNSQSHAACRCLITILARPVQPRPLELPRCNTPATTHMRENLSTLRTLHTILLIDRLDLQYTAPHSLQRNTTTHLRLGPIIPAPIPTRPTVGCSLTTTTVTPTIIHTAAEVDTIARDNIIHNRNITKKTATTAEEVEGE